MNNNSMYWARRNELREKAKSNTELMETVFGNAIDSCVKESHQYRSISVKPTQTQNQEILLDDIDSVGGIFKHAKGKTAVLNFSSYLNPGGKFIDGSSAQEESLCHASYLFNVLTEFKYSFYLQNLKRKNRALYANAAIYSPNISFFLCNKHKECDVITCAAPNKTAAQQYCYVSDEENLRVLRDRIKFVLDVAYSEQVETLILGAYGCGVFGQNPNEVAQTFKELLISSHKCFNKVVFAVPSTHKENYLAFYQQFK